MLTVAAPASIRDKALAIIGAHLLGPTQPERTLGEVGTTMCMILVDLEVTFGIDIEADEVWDHMAARDLVDIVETRLDLQARLSQVGDRIMATVTDLNAERARRARQALPTAEAEALHRVAARIRHNATQAAMARAEPRPSTRAERRRDVRRVFGRLALMAALIGSVAGVVAFVMGA